jgi:transcription antitermination factor NusA-like protein
VRIQAVVSELNGEKIDVVEWSNDPAKFIANALSPAKVLNVTLAEDENGDKVANVVVEKPMLSLAIGKEGQNARLAAKLTGWRIDIKSDEQIAQEARLRAEAEAARVAAMTPEETAAEQAAKVEALEILQAIAAEPAEAPVEPVQAVEPETPAAVVATAPAEVAATEPTPVEASIEAPSEMIVEAPGQPDQTFEEAWAEFEADDEDLSPEELLKRKADKRKRQVLVFDEELGKVVAKRRRKGRRSKEEEWVEEE